MPIVAGSTSGDQANIGRRLMAEADRRARRCEGGAIVLVSGRPELANIETYDQLEHQLDLALAMWGLPLGRIIVSSTLEQRTRHMLRWYALRQCHAQQQQQQQSTD